MWLDATLIGVHWHARSDRQRFGAFAVMETRVVLAEWRNDTDLDHAVREYAVARGNDMPTGTHEDFECALGVYELNYMAESVVPDAQADIFRTAAQWVGQDGGRHVIYESNR